MTVHDNQATAARAQAEILAREAHREAAAAVERIAAAAGARTVHDPAWPATSLTLPRPDTRTGLRAAHRLQQAAGLQLRDYIRHAREDGIGWHELGALLELGADAASRGQTVAAAAFSYAAPPAEPGETPTFTWRCPACQQHIDDHGADCDHPADKEPGHTPGCPRLAAVLPRHDATQVQDG